MANSNRANRKNELPPLSVTYPLPGICPASVLDRLHVRLQALVHRRINFTNNTCGSALPTMFSSIIISQGIHIWDAPTEVVPQHNHHQLEMYLLFLRMAIISFSETSSPQEASSNSTKREGEEEGEGRGRGREREGERGLRLNNTYTCKHTIFFFLTYNFMIKTSLVSHHSLY